MPRGDYATCRNCGGTVEQVGTLSHTRLCVVCGVTIENDNALQMHSGRGPYAARHARRLILAGRRRLIDAEAADG